MFSRILKFSLSAIYLAGMGATRLFIPGRRSRRSCIILYYHSVPGPSRLAFEKQMDIAKSLAVPISVEELQGIQANGRFFGVTFDDGFEDVIENAVPALVRRKIPATIFVTTDVMGTTGKWWPDDAPEKMRRIASSEMLRAVSGEWIQIGSHTLTHPLLTRIPEERARKEMCESRSKLELMMNREIRTFSFPYGDFDGRLARLCHEAGYQRAFTTQHQDALVNPNGFLVGRVKAEPTDWALEFRLKILGGYNWLPRAIKLKRMLIRKMRWAPARPATPGID